MQNVVKFPFYLKLCCTLISILILGYLSIIGQTILVPLIFGFLCAIILLPLANFLERKLRFSRAISAMTCMVLLTLGIVALFTLLGSQLTALVNDWPAFKLQVADSLAHLQQWIADNYHVQYQEQIGYINNAITKSLSTGTTLLGRTLMSITALLIILIFTFLYGFFLLLYRRQIVRFVLSLFAHDHGITVQTVLREIQYIVKRYILGLLLQMLIVSSLTFIAFMIIGVKYSFLLALITGVLNVIPYIGIFSALLLSVLITFATASGSHVIIVLIVVIVIHLVDSNYVMPRIVGSKVKLNSLFAMMAIVAGEMLWGITGMFLAIPMVAIAKVVFDRVQELKSWGYLLGDDENGMTTTNAVVMTSEATATAEDKELPAEDKEAADDPKAGV